MKHAVLGAGAIGGIMATALGSVGEDVALIVRPEKLADYPSLLSWEHPSGTITAPAEAVSRLTEPTDVLWIATKTYQLESALGAIETAPTILVPLLNGVDHVAVLRARFGQDRVIPATIAVEAERRAAGSFVQRSPVRLGIAASGERDLGDTVARFQTLGFSCRFVSDETTLLWSKLCFLAPFALVTSASGKNVGEILADPKWMPRLDLAVAEACTVAENAGAHVDAEAVRAIFRDSPPAMRSSMAKDLATGRRLELDGIAGPIVRGGARYGIPVPTTTGLVATVESLAAVRGA
jgi:2-dehydropantoate 2-reductase